MKVLFAAWELAPFFKVGGLGDVARSLPRALFFNKIDIRVVIPFYKAVNLLGQSKKKIAEFTVDYDKEKLSITVYESRFLEVDIPIYLLQNKKYLDIECIDTFAVFDLATVEMLKKNLLTWTPDVIQCNDAHAALIPFLIKHSKLPIKTLLTIHNLFHQGKRSIDIVRKMGIDKKKCRVVSWEIENKQINFLLEGIVHADLINTVSPTYAKEILTEEFGCGLDDILRTEHTKIFGILNGIDYNIRNSSNDKYLPFHYDLHQKQGADGKTIYDYQQGKKLNKVHLQEILGFEVNEKIPLMGFVGRFTAKQKGIELIHKMLLRMDLEKNQFIFLGKGDEEWEERFLWFAKFHPKNVYFSPKFDEEMASLIYAACDFLLVPSLFEPCGLIQMMAMRYGTLPIARSVGGLKDSIDNGVDGFLFHEYSSHALEKRLNEAVAIKKNDKEKFNKMIETAMKKDFSWILSAKKYIALFEKLCNQSKTS